MRQFPALLTFVGFLLAITAQFGRGRLEEFGNGCQHDGYGFPDRGVARVLPDPQFSAVTDLVIASFWIVASAVCNQARNGVVVDGHQLYNSGGDDIV